MGKVVLCLDGAEDGREKSAVLMVRLEASYGTQDATTIVQ